MPALAAAAPTRGWPTAPPAICTTDSGGDVALTFRGYDVHTLAEHTGFDEVVHLPARRATSCGRPRERDQRRRSLLLRRGNAAARPRCRGGAARLQPARRTTDRYAARRPARVRTCSGSSSPRASPKSKRRAPYLAVDVGTGREWLTTRLLIFASCSRRCAERGCWCSWRRRARSRGRFVGLATGKCVRWSLAHARPAGSVMLAMRTVLPTRSAAGP